MNAKTDDITLPELPKPWDLQHDDVGKPQVLYTAEQMRAYAISVLADRAERAVPAAKAVRDLDPIDLKIECFPRPIPGAMQVGMPVGVLIRHRPTGLCVIVDNHRSQHRNRDEALRQLTFLVDFVSFEPVAAATKETP